MTSNRKICILKSENSDYLDVKLPDGIPIIVGRGPLTRIKSKKCSKQQVKLTANYEQAVVEIVQLGPNASQVDNSSLKVNTSITVSEGTVLNFLKGEFPYVITFVKETPESKSTVQNSIIKKLFDELEQKINVDIKSEPHTSCHNRSESYISKITSNLKRKEEYNNTEISEKYNKLEFDRENKDDSKEEEEHIKEIEKKLHIMQQQIIKPPIKSSEMTSVKISPKRMHSDASNKSNWEEVESGKLFLYTKEDPNASTKIASFDLDHTIITTKSGRVFPKDNHDWRIMLSEIPAKLKCLIEEGYKIVIFTNQRNISKGRTDPADFRKKLEHIGKKLGIPLQIFVSTGVGIYRKPAPGMWDTLVKLYNEGVPVDLTSCFYCGDAAGRPANWTHGKKKDFSSSDRLFALNLQIQFYTPEEFFLGYKKAEFSMPKFDPRSFPDLPMAEIVKSSNKHCPISLDQNSLISTSPEIVVFVGFPAAGKTHFALNYLIPKGYIHVNRDALGSWQKCVSHCKMELDKGHSVVIDNTNPDTESRKRYTEIAMKCNVPCRCFLFPVSLEHAKHNNMFRQTTAADKIHVGVNDMVLNSYRSKYKEPEIEEGFKDIVKINFKAAFRNKEEERLYRMFLIDK